MIDVLTPQEWAGISDNAYICTFLEKGRSKLDRIDFAILVSDADGVLQGFNTLREFDAETVYISHGGVFPKSQGQEKSHEYFKEVLDYLKENYNRAVLFTQNDHIVMIKLALKSGFIVTGLKTFKDETYLEFTREFKGEEQ